MSRCLQPFESFIEVTLNFPWGETSRKTKKFKRSTLKWKAPIAIHFSFITLTLILKQNAFRSKQILPWKKKDIKGFSISQKVMFPPAGNYKKTWNVTSQSNYSMLQF